MNTQSLYLVTYSITYHGVSFGHRSARASGDTASDALTRFHRWMQLRKSYKPHEYRVTGLSELDRTHRTVIARLPFPPGPNPRVTAPACEDFATRQTAAAQMHLAI